MFSQEVMDMLIKGIGETLYMTLGATIFGYVLGLPMGILMTTTAKDGIQSECRCLQSTGCHCQYWTKHSVLDPFDFVDAFDKGQLWARAMALQQRSFPLLFQQHHLLREWWNPH